MTREMPSGLQPGAELNESGDELKLDTRAGISGPKVTAGEIRSGNGGPGARYIKKNCGVAFLPQPVNSLFTETYDRYKLVA